MLELEPIKDPHNPDYDLSSPYLETGRYDDGGLAVVLHDRYEGPVATLSTNLAEYGNSPLANSIWVKQWDPYIKEMAGILVERGVLRLYASPEAVVSFGNTLKLYAYMPAFRSLGTVTVERIPDDIDPA